MNDLKMAKSKISHEVPRKKNNKEWFFGFNDLFSILMMFFHVTQISGMANFPQSKFEKSHILKHRNIVY